MCSESVLVPIPALLWNAGAIHDFDAGHPEYGVDEAGQCCLRIDACIVPVVQKLWDQGVVTLSCCCGHGDPWGVVTIQTRAGVGQRGAMTLRAERYDELIAAETEREMAVADAARWRGHHRHAGKVIARLQRAIQTYWSACHAEQAVADADDWSPDAAHEAALATQEARDGLWLALDLPSPWTSPHPQSEPQPAAPVDRSAEAEQSKVPTGFIEVRPGLYERQRPAPNWDQPPDHQAGDES